VVVEIYEGFGDIFYVVLQDTVYILLLSIAMRMIAVSGCVSEDNDTLWG
jgi:hypothetical protein